MDFLSPQANRLAIINEILNNAALEHEVLELDGGRHIIVSPPLPKEKYLQRPPIILVAHYDRAEGSPGANDNSAAVFILLETAIKLKKNRERNWIIIFTDREELKSGDSIQTQGSYALAKTLTNLKTENAKIFNFDACGRGDTIIISSTMESLLKKEKSRKKLQESIISLRQYALGIAHNLNMAKVLLAPVPFSDDAGFLRAGLAAQTITVLPSSECIKLVAELRRNPELQELLISAEMQQEQGTRLIPETWRTLNSPTDSHIRLTPEHFRTLARFAEALCRNY